MSRLSPAGISRESFPVTVYVSPPSTFVSILIPRRHQDVIETNAQDAWKAAYKAYFD